MPELVYDVKFRIDPASAQRVAGAASGTGAGRTASAGQGAEKAAKDVKQLELNFDRAAEAAQDLGAKSRKALKQTQDSLKRGGNAAIDYSNKLGTAASRTTKGFSTANQVLFSFSDGINDAAQFSQGFGVGMRAVGNNIGFTIELLTSLNTRVQQHNALVKAGAIENGKMMTSFGMLRASLAGPGGLLLAVNAAITLMTVLGTRTKKTEDETRSLAERMADLASSLTGDFGIGIKSTQDQIDALNLVLDRNTETLDKVLQQAPDITRFQQDFATAASDGANAVRDQSSAINELSVVSVGQLDALKRAEESAANARKTAVLTVIRERIAELEATQLMNEALKELGVETDQFAGFKSRQEEIKTFMELEQSTRQLIQDGIDDQIQEELRERLRLQELFREREIYLRDLIMNPPPRPEEPDESPFIRQALRNEQNLQKAKQETTKAIIQAGVAQFQNNKMTAIASALIDTYLAAQKAYASQLVVGDPTSVVRAKVAAALAVAQGLARVAIIRATQPGSSGGNGGGGGGRGTGGAGNTGGRLPSPKSSFSTSGEFMPQSPERYQTVNINVENRIDRRGLAFLVKGGNADISSSSVTTRSR